MSVASFGFLLLVLVASSFFHLLPSVVARRAVLVALNAAFLGALVPNSASMLALAVFLATGWAVARWVAVRPRRFVVPAYVALLVAAFLVGKKYTFLAFFSPALLDHPIGILGLSYMLFRQIHFVVDAAQGQIARPSLSVYLNYQLNVFTVLSGPIQRYQDYSSYWGSVRPAWTTQPQLLKAYLRLFWGLLQLVVLGDLCLQLYDNAVAGTDWNPLLRGAAIFYAYPGYVFLNFAGYCSVVIASASLFGMILPENFNRPYLARNMIDYWNRWHITLSHWIRDYVFTPSYTGLARRWPKKSKTIGPFCFFIAFLIAGLWHGSTGNFAVFGLLNGLGVSAAKVWENHIIAARGRKGLKVYMQSRATARVANLLTVNYACATILFFPGDLAGWNTIVGLLTGAPA